MAFENVPEIIASQNETQAVAVLQTYFEKSQNVTSQYTGAYFDTWPGNSTNEFTIDDIYAVTCLSVDIPPWSVRSIVGSSRFSDLLCSIDPETDLVDVSLGTFASDSWAGSELMRELQTLNGVGLVIASKLLARKRPRIRPIYDSVVRDVVGSKRTFWADYRETMLATPESHSLSTHDWLQQVLTRPDVATVSTLRAFDVIAWMQGRGRTARVLEKLDPSGVAIV